MSNLQVISNLQRKKEIIRKEWEANVITLPERLTKELEVDDLILKTISKIHVNPDGELKYLDIQ